MKLILSIFFLAAVVANTTGFDISLPIPYPQIRQSSLFANVYYRIRQSELRDSWVTWSSVTVNGNYLMIADNSGSKEYNECGSYYADSEWKFIPSKSVGWYLFYNKGLGLSATTHDKEEGVWLLPNNEKNATITDYQLFNPEEVIDGTSGQLYYRLRNKATHKVLAWTTSRLADGVASHNKYIVPIDAPTGTVSGNAKDRFEIFYP